MRTSEIRDYMNDFCKVLNMTNERHTFEFEEDISNMRIVRHIGKFRGEVCSVLKDAQGIYFVNVNDYIKCSNIYLIEFIGNVRNYAETSLDERKDERRWRIHFGTSDINYLNQDKETGTYERNTERETNSYKTKFTRSEIADWAGTNSDEIIDWIIDKFGEEVE